MKYLKHFENFINDEIQPEDDEIQPEDDEIQPEEDDCFIESNGFKYSVSCSGKHLGEFVEWDDAIQSVKDHLEGSNFFPSCWFVSDHGNISPLEINL